MDSDTPTIHGSKSSQPCKTLLMFCRLNNLPFNFNLVEPAKGETRTQQFLAKNPLGQIPVLTQGNFNLSESFAICLHLAQTNKICNQWWPRDLRIRAKISEYLHWHNGMIRYCGYYVLHTFIQPQILKKQPDQWKINDLKVWVDKSMEYVEKAVAGGNFIAGTTEPSLADLAAYNEISSLKLTNWNFSEYPNIGVWMRRVEQNAVVRNVNREAEEELMNVT